MKGKARETGCKGYRINGSCKKLMDRWMDDWMDGWIQMSGPM